jgi:hypothetical protein
MFKSVLLATAIAVVGLSGEARAANIITNGNFAAGNLNGWTLGGTYLTYPVLAYPLASGNANYPLDPLTAGSPDLGAGYAAYFVDDLAHNQSLEQTVTLAAGNYEVGFDLLVPLNGAANVNDATLSAVIAGTTLLNAAASSLTAGVWTHYSTDIDVVTAGSYSADFDFNSFGSPAKDFMVDRIYIIPTATGGGTPIGAPEPATLSVLAMGLVGVGATRWRRPRGQAKATTIA